MKIDLSRHIVDHLNRFGHVELPGLGRFDKIYSSAGFKQGVHNLSPPQIELAYQADLKLDDNGLANWISDREGIDIEKANAVVNFFVKQKKIHLESDDKVSIYPLGFLVDAGDHIQFESSDSPLINEYLNLKPIHLKPVEGTAEEKTVIASKSKEDAFAHLYATEKKESNPIWRWIGIILLALFLALFYKMCNDRKAAQASEKTTSQNIEDNEDTQLETALTEDSSVASSTISKSNSTEEGKKHIDNLKSEDIDTVLESEEIKSAGPKDLVECIIIVGSYTKQRNAIRMMQDVENNGHKLYVGVNGDYTRVGIKFNCQKEDLVEYIQNIRRQFIREAWYLVPELRVEYE